MKQTKAKLTRALARDEFFMQEALKQAHLALKKDEVPVGAVMVCGEKIIARAFNLRQSKRQATFHAEILLIEKTCKKLKDFRLNDCEMFVTLEPCVMCLGAALNARIKRLVFGASINKEGAIKSQEIAERAMLNSNISVVGGVLADECSKLVSDYFLDKRKV